mmetsp:Transcript_26471/g.61492  ORF Transcript_26471/g.61492 Transcript_26471/m.61492 type:complete len:207 (+) Transcript_26471:420-1040(+)
MASLSKPSCSMKLSAASTRMKSSTDCGRTSVSAMAALKAAISIRRVNSLRVASAFKDACSRRNWCKLQHSSSSFSNSERKKALAEPLMSAPSVSFGIASFEDEWNQLEFRACSALGLSSGRFLSIEATISVRSRICVGNSCQGGCCCMVSSPTSCTVFACPWKMPVTASGPLRGTRAVSNWKKTTPREKMSPCGCHLCFFQVSGGI